ncbi:Uncharacterized protein dnm_025620 [Desulfonema magnum]|uniref:Uncharacterized protein n=2 Tax=Desulfonema magnum TaxID=45655 RepID=A0A975BJM2_9BACT|nr:Uncharacterized protein dnm_025620 [Desulfonema magnum]
MHFNLPPNDIKDHMNLKKDAGFFKELAASAMLSQTVAKWQYYNFFIVKFAYSERLDMVMVALPFCKWAVLDSNNQ